MFNLYFYAIIFLYIIVSVMKGDVNTRVGKYYSSKSSNNKTRGLSGQRKLLWYKFSSATLLQLGTMPSS